MLQSVATHARKALEKPSTCHLHERTIPDSASRELVLWRYGAMCMGNHVGMQAAVDMADQVQTWVEQDVVPHWGHLQTLLPRPIATLRKRYGMEPTTHNLLWYFRVAHRSAAPTDSPTLLAQIMREEKQQFYRVLRVNERAVSQRAHNTWQLDINPGDLVLCHLNTIVEVFPHGWE